VHGIINELREEFGPNAYNVRKGGKEAVLRWRQRGRASKSPQESRTLRMHAVTCLSPSTLTRNTIVLSLVLLSSQITNRNCNHFSDALCKTLVGASIPAWVNRPAKIASVFSVGVFGGRNKKEKEGEKEGGGVTKAEKAAAGKRKKLTEEQKARLKAIKGKTTRGT